MTTMPMTLDLPLTLKRQLQKLAKFEGVSLDRYILYTLTERANKIEQFYPLSDEEVAVEREKFAQFRETLHPKATPEEFEAYMASLPLADPDPDYPPELHEKYMAKIAEAKARKQKA